MEQRIVIIGGGVIGLCTAYFLRKQGHEVIVVDGSNLDAGASYVNAGYLTPSHFIPLAAPGMVSKGLRWMFDSRSPLYIKPRFNPSFLKWARAFQKSCTKTNVSRSVGVIKDLNLRSAELFSAIKKTENFNFQLENKGLVMLCQSEEQLEEELHVASIGKAEGLAVTEISKDSLKQLEPNVAIDAIGAVHYHCDWHTTPGEFMTELYQWLEQNDVTFYKNEMVTDLVRRGNSIQEIVTQNRKLTADAYVLAAGTWSASLGRKLGLSIPLEAGKGYRIDVAHRTGISMPAILAEASVAVTPMNGFTRFAGTMEIGGINHNIHPQRVKAIASAAQRYYPGLHIPDSALKEASCGLRPVSPDGRPYIGRSKKCQNLVVATGHAMQGWSMGPGTGKLVSQLIEGTKTFMPLDGFHPDRKF
ncbi:MAG: FAD-dependent oxidoreductase [Bacteroidota bacterium]